jgi:ABC-type amino acid transport substrate-binding protein
MDCLYNHAQMFPRLAALLVAFVGLPAANGSLDAADLGSLKAGSTLRVLVASDESPDTFAVEPGPRAGFERELIEGFAKVQGLTVAAVPVKTHADRIPALLAGKGDVIVAIFDTEDRRRLIDFTAEVMPTHNVAVTMRPRAPVASLEELRKLRVGVIHGTKPAEAALEAGIPPASIQGFEKVAQLLDALKTGTVAAAVLPISELALAGKRVVGLEAGTTIGSPGTIAWAVRKEDGALRAALTDYLANTRKGGSWNRLVLKYFGEETLRVLGRAR